MLSSDLWNIVLVPTLLVHHQKMCLIADIWQKLFSTAHFLVHTVCNILEVVSVYQYGHQKGKHRACCSCIMNLSLRTHTGYQSAEQSAGPSSSILISITEDRRQETEQLLRPETISSKTVNLSHAPCKLCPSSHNWELTRKILCFARRRWNNMYMTADIEAKLGEQRTSCIEAIVVIVVGIVVIAVLPHYQTDS